MTDIEYLFILIFFVSLGFLAGSKFGMASVRKTSLTEHDQSVYAIFCGEVHDQHAFSKYQEQAIPLAKKAGLEIVGVAESPYVLEGIWPYSGALVIEKFSSLQELKRYRESRDYKQARDLVGDSATTHFAVVVDAYKH
ncbi:DUF1330 domain-containing protein [SAR92 clade bacterium H246]